ncbi:MAG: carbohydrate kinase family protein [Candidatus Levybacteria bacterium]|nr:carbohydrate kinase family protein [Candidatus Levybacteria bacterium]
MDKGIDVLCIGSTTIDVFIMLQKLQKFTYDKFSNQISFTLGEKVPLDEYTIALGGNACNVAVGLSRLGFKTSLAAEVGSDELQQKIPNTLAKEGVDMTFLKKEETKNPYFNVILSYGGERTILEEKNPLGLDLEVGYIDAKLVFLTNIRGGWEKVYESIFSKYKNARFAMNPGTRQIMETADKLIEILPKIEILFVNLQEAQKIIKDNNPDVKSILNKLKTHGVKIAVVTDGINGSYAINKTGEMFHIGVVTSERPIERTGAGDSYATGFLWAALNGHSVQEAMRYAAINANSVIKKIGAQEGLLNKEEMEQKSKQNLALTAVKI